MKSVPDTFLQLVILKVGTQYYDPSYGLEYNNTSEFQQRALSGFFSVKAKLDPKVAWSYFRKTGTQDEIEFHGLGAK